ncbi:MAG: FKBP-type peptidyl-prolyl cis-trans isomerase [Gammaproteobacteria bacterium]|nr:FKBP-type peptidyl-prolyl cis-trans isomerase [Gammaproteobacteria bacterium]
MTALSVPVSEGTRVFVNFSLSLEDGSEIDSNFSDDAVDFVVGDGSLLPGFERLMFGMCAGDRQIFSVAPERAFGMANDSNVQELERAQFDADVELEIGLIISFADARGGEVPGLVVECDEEWVTVDFNHPLAGRTLLFDVLVHRVEAAELH